MIARSVLPLTLLTVLAACSAEAPPPPVVDTQADEAAIRALTDQELQLAAAGDPVAFASVMTADAIAMPPNEPAKTGAALTQWLSDFMAGFSISAQPYTHEEITVLGDVAIHRFSFTWTITPKAGGAAVTESGKGIHILRRQADGTWRISRDVWNMDAPPPAM
ncbi:MAG: SgcJ/EcaC family oxidoreductase [Gemmatimonadetes bacterium]|nr:SgcJ/EcaC family oxidoreductase [Gemmatimonadota bacterium]